MTSETQTQARNPVGQPRKFPPYDSHPDYLRALEQCYRWVPNDDDCYRHHGPHEPFRCNGAMGRLIEVHHSDAALREQTRITVEPFRRLIDAYDHPDRYILPVEIEQARAALPHDSTPGEER